MHSIFYEVDHPLAEGGETMLVRHGDDAVFPVFSDLVEHRRDHADQHIDWPAPCRYGLVHDPGGSIEIVLPARGEKAAKYIAQKNALSYVASLEQIEFAVYAGYAQNVRDGEIMIFRALAGKLLAIGTPLQHELPSAWQ